MTDRVTSARDRDTVHSATKLMSLNKVRRLPVISHKNGSQKITGMITNKMILRLLESCLAYQELHIGMNVPCGQLLKAATMEMPLIDPREVCGTVAYLMRERGRADSQFQIAGDYSA